MFPEYLDIPIFPLPNVTLFPKTLLPLHVFEPRYRKMIANCLAGDRMLGVALLREGWQKNYFGNPPLHKTFGVGKIVDYEELDNNCYNIMVEGLYRARLITEYETEHFRTGRVSVLQDGPIDHRRKEVAPLYKEMTELSRNLTDLMPEFRETIHNACDTHPHPAVTADLLAASVVIDSYDRQSILEEPDPIRRMKLVLVQLNNVVLQVSQNNVHDSVLEEELLEED